LNSILDPNKYDAMEQQLQMIIDIGFDYDGEHGVVDLKKLVDELVEMARQGLQGRRPYWIKPIEGDSKYVERVKQEDGSMIEVELSPEKIVEYTKEALDS